MPFASESANEGTVMLGGSIGVASRTPICATIGRTIRTASAMIFFLCRAKTAVTFALSTTELVQRAHHGADDSRGIFHAVEMRDTRRGVTHLDRHLDDGDPFGDRAEEHLCLE